MAPDAASTQVSSLAAAASTDPVYAAFAGTVREPPPDLGEVAGTGALAAIVAAFAAAPVGIVVVDAHGTIVSANAACSAMFAYDVEELAGRCVDELLPPDARAAHSRHRAGFGVDPHPKGMGSGRELLARRADGSTFPVEVGLGPVQLPSGPATVAVVVDLGARVEMESLFRGAFDHAPYGLAIVNDRGTIVQANSRMEQLAGHHRGALAGQPIDVLIPPQHHGEHHNELQRYFEAPTTRSMGAGRELSALHADGSEIPVEVGLSPVQAAGSTSALVTVNDVTDRVRLARRLLEAEIELEEFTAVASRELRSPLRGIADLADWIEEGLEGTERDAVAHNLDRLRSRVLRMEQLIDQLLECAKLGRATAPHRRVELGAVVETIVADVPVPDGFRITVDVDVEPFTAVVPALETVLRNVVLNALQHHDGDDGTVAIVARAERGVCRIEVTDDGPGIAAGDRARVFRLFETVGSRRSQHAGIGLAVSRRLCAAHGATIALQSAVGRGSTFVVEWPLRTRRELLDD